MQMHLKNVGPHRSLALDLPTTPGVYVIRGNNGAGKSYLLEGVLSRAAGGDGRLEPTDGRDKGEVTLTEDGATFTLRVAKRVTADGQLPIHIPTSEGRALAEFIRPSVQDPEARELARVKALCSLARLEPTPDRIRALASDVAVQLKPGATIIDAAKAARTALQNSSREYERHAEQAAGEVNSASRSLEAVADAVDPGMSVGEAEAEYRRLERESAILQNGAQQREQAEQRLEQIRSSRGPRPDEGQLQAKIEWTERRITEAEDEVRILQEKLQQAQTNRQLLLAERGQLCNEHTRITRAAEQWDREQAQLEQPIDGPTWAESVEAESKAQAARQVLEQARAWEQRRRLEETRSVAVRRQMEAEEQAMRLREQAAAVWSRLGSLLEDAGLEDFAWEDGTLCVRLESGKLEPYNDTRLSFGQRVFYALKAALQSVPGDLSLPVLFPVPADFWLSLDPDHKAEVVSQAYGAGIALLTEDPSDGGALRIEPYYP